MSLKIITPEGWKRPRGYSNAVSAAGRLVFVAGQIGWTELEEWQSDDLVGQTAQTLRNVIALLQAAEAGPEHIARMTWYVTDRQDYLANLQGIGEAYREIIGRHYPAMTAVEVSGLIEDRALVEIECTAVVPH
ncbi:MAG: RidA family protein [Rhodospirillaceae bacterium]|jgi:enamine deaminase RidA (YjgF/YER057c/UK114 family)|nr:RidA family protein [Rhodospirillaceae bacterium]MBT6139791.1 RidA family protein [Rhodospirillaceae bacterium]